MSIKWWWWGRKVSVKPVSIMSCLFKYPAKWKHAMIIFANIWNGLRDCWRLSGQDRQDPPRFQILKTKALSNVLSLSFSRSSLIRRRCQKAFIVLLLWPKQFYNNFQPFDKMLNLLELFPFHNPQPIGRRNNVSLRNKTNVRAQALYFRLKIDGFLWREILHWHL